MIKVWIVICDCCGREIDATKEIFNETEQGQICENCYIGG